MGTFPQSIPGPQGSGQGAGETRVPSPADENSKCSRWAALQAALHCEGSQGHFNHFQICVGGQGPGVLLHVSFINTAVFPDGLWLQPG